MLTTKYDGCGIFMGGDKNKMDISPIIHTNLKLKQINFLPTRKNEILDVCITNLFLYYNAPIIIPPVQPDIPGQGVASDHSVSQTETHTTRPLVSIEQLSHGRNLILKYVILASGLHHTNGPNLKGNVTPQLKLKFLKTRWG